MDTTALIENITLARRMDTAEDVRAFLADCVALLGSGFHPDTEGERYADEGGNAILTWRQVHAFDALMERARHVADVHGLDVHAETLALLPELRAELGLD